MDYDKILLTLVTDNDLENFSVIQLVKIVSKISEIEDDNNETVKDNV